MTNEVFTSGHIARTLGEPPSRINYLIERHKIEAVGRAGIIRLYGAEQVKLIRQALYVFKQEEFPMNQPNIKNGYVLLPRIVIEGLGGATPLAVALYVWLLCRASHKTRQGFNCTYQRGQLFTSIDMMRDAMKYKSGYRWVRPTRDMLRSAIGALTRAALITTAKTTRGLIVTICQYDFYQNLANYGTRNGDTTEPHTESEIIPHYIQRIKKNGKNGRSTPQPFSYKSFDQLDRERAAAATEKAMKEFLNDAQS